MHRSIGPYSGPVIYGKKTDLLKATGSRAGIRKEHLVRSVFLTTGVETGFRLGSIMAADGTGISCGLGQHIMVYPKELAREDFNAQDDQGGLGKLLREMELLGTDEVNELWDALGAYGLFLSQLGEFRWTDSGEAKLAGETIEHAAGDLVHGAILREVIVPDGGKVPKSGQMWERAKAWALLFHKVFSNPETAHTQFIFEHDHLCKRIKSRRYRFHSKRRLETIHQVIYGTNRDIQYLESSDLSEELDLAMSVFHSHTVNAPSVAFRKLRETLQDTAFAPDKLGSEAEVDFARKLLMKLAKAKYGRWMDSQKNGRWERTRKVAKDSGFWPRAFFRGNTAIMPVQF